VTNWFSELAVLRISESPPAEGRAAERPVVQRLRGLLDWQNQKLNFNSGVHMMIVRMPLLAALVHYSASYPTPGCPRKYQIVDIQKM
jgi:hypothetical protein